MPKTRDKGQSRRDRTVIEIKHAPKSLAAPDSLAEGTGLSKRLQKTIPDSLVISLTMVMHDVFRQRTFQRAPAEEDHPANTLLLHRAHESFSKGIQISAISAASRLR